MKDLLTFILEGITGEKDFDISETEEDNHILLEVKVPSEIIGLIIGKNGNTIKSIQNILRVKGRVENKMVNLNVTEL